MRDRNFEKMTNEVIDKTFNPKVIPAELEEKLEETISKYWEDQAKYEKELLKHYKGNIG